MALASEARNREFKSRHPDMYQVLLTQQEVIDTLIEKIRQVLMRPGMYVGKEDALGYYHLITAYVDALALARSGYTGGFMYGEVRQPDASKSAKENIDDITADVKRILDTPVTMRKSDYHR